MSNGRIEHDNYPTSPWCVSSLLGGLRELGIVEGDLEAVLDPSAGAGAILAAAALHGGAHTLHALELRAEEAHNLEALGASYRIADALDLSIEPLAGVPAICNPPFDLSELFVATWAHGRPWAAFLVRLDWYASAKRAELLEELPPAHVLVMPNRPAFVATCAPRCARWHWPYLGLTCDVCGQRIKASTDSREYAWIVWREDHVGATTIHRLELVDNARRSIVWDPVAKAFTDRNVYKRINAGDQSLVIPSLARRAQIVAERLRPWPLPPTPEELAAHA